jgi:AcrR family transcriptional regulator
MKFIIHKASIVNIRPRLDPEQTRLRIMDVAEEHFRRVGYAKTAVADIAEALGMSAANVYRFFASKGAITEAICLRILGEEHAMIDMIVAQSKPAGERLRTLLIELHRFNRSRFIGERRVHDMVEAAMEENWGAVEEHLRYVIQHIGMIIASGIETGEFRPCDIAATALTVKNACTCILHPMMIAECMRHGRDMEEHADRISNFVVNALRVKPE